MLNNLITTAYMLGLLAIVIIINTVLGVVIANKKVQFSWTKLINGLAKSLVIVLCILLFCISLELVPIVLLRVDIQVPDDLVTVLEIILVTLTAYKKYATDCFEKFKTILKIKESE